MFGHKKVLTTCLLIAKWFLGITLFFHYDHLCDTVARSVVVVFVLILSFTKKGGVMITEGVAVAIDIGVVSHFSFTFTAVIGATDTVLFP